MKGILIIVVLSLFSLSCSQQVTSTEESTSFESRIATPPPGEEGTTTYLLSICTPMNHIENNFRSQIEPRTRNGENIDDEMFLRIKTISAGILSGTEYIQFFKEYENVNLQTFTNPDPIEFKFINSAGTILNTITPINQISSASMQLAIEESGLDDYYQNFFNKEYTPAHLISNYDIVLTGLDIKYESIRTAFYNNNSNTATSFVAALIPAYAADPNVFASLDNSIYMSSIHPMAHRKHSGLSQSAFKSEIEDQCR